MKSLFEDAESSGLELFLDSVLQGEIVAVVSFDEASTMFGFLFIWFSKD